METGVSGGDPLHHQTGGDKFLATQICLLTRFSVPLRLRPRARSDRRAHPRRAGSCSSTRSQRRAQAQDDRQQDRIGQDAAGQRHATQGSGREPQCLCSDAVPLVAGLRLSVGLTYFAIRILRRPLIDYVESTCSFLERLQLGSVSWKVCRTMTPIIHVGTLCDTPTATFCSSTQRN